VNDDGAWESAMKAEGKMTRKLIPVGFVNGMTVRELKDLVKDWPENNAYTGEETEVWIGSGDEGTSNQVKYAWPLNHRMDDEGESADLLLEWQDE